MVQFKIILATFCLTSIVGVFSEKTKVIVDTDGDADDAVAILILLKKEEYEILGITCSAVEVSTKEACEKVSLVLEHVGKTDIKLIAGPSQNLIGEDKFGGSDDIKTDVAQFISDTIQKNTGKILLYAMGSFTNLALAEHQQPGILMRVQEIYFIGGIVDGQYGLENKEWIEKSLDADPEAAKLIFSLEKKSKKIHVLPYDVCVKEIITIEAREEILFEDDFAFLNQVEQQELAEDKEKFGHWTPCDALLVALSIEKKVIHKVESADAEVETCGEKSRGAMFLALTTAESRVDAHIIMDLKDDVLTQVLTSLLNKPTPK